MSHKPLNKKDDSQGRSQEQDVFVSLQRTAEQLMDEVAELLKPHGLSVTQYNVLRILRGAALGKDRCDKSRRATGASQDTGLACSEIGQRLIKRDPDITRLLDRLESRGLISRNRDLADRRVITTRITPTGLDALKDLDGPIEKLHASQMKPLTNDQMSQLLQLLEDLRERPSDQPHNTKGTDHD